MCLVSYNISLKVYVELLNYATFQFILINLLIINDLVVRTVYVCYYTGIPIIITGLETLFI